MTTVVNQRRYLSRGIDYLGDLGAKLLDLQGFSTLAHELIQNADDADGAGQICFRVSQDDLIVDNDGQFSECEDVEASECLWKQVPGRGYCDFHGFRSVASGHKREREGTTGAFGIGFISVYQITDRPELISAGRHWILHEDRPESERIEVCDGCSVCKVPGLPNTRFILPWAFDANTTLRKALRAPALTPDAPSKFLDELRRSLPTAILFLKNLNAMDVPAEDKSMLSLQRILEGDSLIVSDGKKDCIWHLLRGDFEETANELRARHADRIEPKRTSKVTLAIPEDPFDLGLLCACLPAQEGKTGLPFHINADFFPHSDRKRIIFEHDYQSEWNRAAIRAAAGVLCDHLHCLPAKLGHKHLWHLFNTVQQVGDDAKKGHKEESFGEFWERLRPKLRESKVFFTSCKEWKNAGEVVFPSEKEEEDVVPILEGLELSVLSTELRPYFNLFRSKEVGVPLLDIGHIADALEASGLNKRVELDELPAFLQSEKALRLLRRELATLLARSRPPDDNKKLARCAVMPGRDKALWPCNQIFRADDETIALFSGIDPSIPFLAEYEEEAKELGALCQEFTPAVAVERLTRLLIHSDSEADAAKIDPVAVLRWFEDQRAELHRSSAVMKDLAALPLFPCSEGLKPLTELSLTGDFTDPIGLAGVVDLARLKGRRDFLRELGAQELTFAHYARNHVPRAFRQPEIPAEQKRSVVQLLAERIGEIRDNDEIRLALAEVPMIECTDGQFRRPPDVYFDLDVVRVVLGDEVPLALLPKHHESATQDLYDWLGVAESPRFEAVTRRIKTLTASPPIEEPVEAIGIIFRHLGQRLGQEEKNDPALMELRSLLWLPARGDQNCWRRPGDLYAVFQDYLFDTQARFIDLPRDMQNASREFLDFLLVKFNPTPAQVVAHLLKCSATGTPVNKAVYIYLNDNVEDRALDLLRDKPCLLLPDNSYVKPSQVFWREHPFGRYRHRLGSDLRKYGDLFARLGVRESPSHEDALAVLREISNEFGTPNRLLDEDTHAFLLACWQRLDRALQEEQIASGELAALSSTKVIPDTRGLLNPPAKMFFEDRPGLSTKFKSFLDNDVIPRPQGAWRAMLEAGVRLLSTAVRAHLVECKDPGPDERVMDLLRERRRQLLRVLEAGENANGQPDLGLLDRVQCLSVGELRVQYSVKAFNREVSSDPEDLPAKFQAADSTLYFVRRGDDLPWPSIARELALALCPEADPGRLAAGIKEVLAAASEDEAAAILDELGFAPLAVAVDRPAVESGVVEDLGGEKAPPELPQQTKPVAAREFPTSGDSPGADGRPRGEGSTQPPDHTKTGTPIPTPDGDPLTPDDAITRLLGPGANSPTPLPAELQKQLQSQSEGAGPAYRDPGTSQRRDGQRRGERRAGDRDGERRPSRGGHPVLRSYVSHEDPEADREVDPMLAERRERVNRQGMNRILESERLHCRNPREMPPLNPGYDVESDNDSGQVERYIEVKSLSGDWEGPHAGMTNTQFRRNENLGHRYWLYVVERADQPDFKIWRIQNPAQRVTSFMFDDGWKNIAEQDDEEEAGTPGAPVEEQT